MNFLNGFIFIVVGFVTLLAQFAVIDLVFPYVWPILMVLYGFYLILSSQRKLVSRQEQKKAMKKEKKREKQIVKATLASESRNSQDIEG